METTIVKGDLIKNISCLSIINQMVETIWVTQSEGQITIGQTLKEKNVVRHITENINYKLKSHRLLVKRGYLGELMIISDMPGQLAINTESSICHSASYDLNKVFINEIGNFKNLQRHKIRFYQKNFWEKLTKKSGCEDLVNKIVEVGKNCSWAIVSQEIYDTISSSNLFQPKPDHNSGSLIKRVGKVENVAIYLNPNENKKNIYFGNYGSVTIIVNKDIRVESVEGFEQNSDKAILIEYAFLETGLTKLLEIS